MHERLGGHAEAISVAPVDDGEFQSLLEMFAMAVRQIPGRVVLILDTCEELAKMKADGSPQGAVEVTFKVLAQLHALVPSLRVVFCGRRPLASEGAGWSCVRPADRQGLPPRTYLRLHEIRNFSAQEARQYLLEREECRADLVEPILPHCREKGYAPLFSNSTTIAEERYSPFDLALYANWVSSEPDVTPQEVAATGLDQYVRTRIVGRIENRELASVIPAIAWVGQVDEAAMASLAGLEPGSARAAQLSAEMERQEWVAGAAGGGFLVLPEMRGRLLDYFAQNNRSAYDAGRSAAADYLEQALPKTSVRDMPVVHLEAALEALQPEPERAARWWKAIDDRILSEEAWDWVLAPTLRLLADEHWPPAVLKGKHIRAAIAATRAAALVQTGDVPKAQETSRMMEADAANYPHEAERWNLELLARALRAEGDPRDVSGEVASAALTAIEWALEQKGEPSQEESRRWLQWLDDVVTAETNIEQQSFGLVLAGRIVTTLELPPEADPNGTKLCFQGAFGLAPHFERHTERTQWRFWKAPKDLASRLRLEFLRWAWPLEAGPSQLEWWLAGPDEIGDVDSDRLAAAVLAIQGAQRMPVLNEKIKGLLKGSTEAFASEQRWCSAHRHFPPYFAVAAEEMAYAGRVPEAIDILTEEASVTEGIAAAFRRTLDVDRALTGLISRFRLGDEGWSPSESLEYGGELKDRVAVRAQQALNGAPLDFRNEDLESAANMHARWSYLHCVRQPCRAADVGVGWQRLCGFAVGAGHLRGNVVPAGFDRGQWTRRALRPAARCQALRAGTQDQASGGAGSGLRDRPPHVVAGHRPAAARRSGRAYRIASRRGDCVGPGRIAGAARARTRCAHAALRASDIPQERRPDALRDRLGVPGAGLRARRAHRRSRRRSRHPEGAVRAAPQCTHQSGYVARGRSERDQARGLPGRRGASLVDAAVADAHGDVRSAVA